MTKIIQTLRENKKPIIISLVVGILLFYLQPTLNFIGTQTVNLFAALSNKFSNHYYTLVAQNNPNLISDYVASIITLLYWFVVFNVLMELYIAIQDSETKLQNIEQTLKGFESDSKKETMTLELEIAQLQINIKEFQTNIKKKKTLMKSAIVIGFLMFLYYSFQQSIYSQVNTKNVSFQNRLVVLSIHLNDNEIKKLKAKWVQIKSFDNYKKIIDEISDYEKKYNVTK